MPARWSSSICCRLLIACAVALPAGIRGSATLCAVRAVDDVTSESYGWVEVVLLSAGEEEVIDFAVVALSASSFFWAATFARSYRALTSPPVHLVPKSVSQKVKNG